MRAPGMLSMLVTLAVAACAPGPSSSGPVPLAIAPDQATPDGAVDVEITGRGFDADVRTDYGNPSGSSVASTFAARFVPVSGGPGIPLEAVTLTERRTLAARVPAGLATGGYDLVVADPQGREGLLRNAFRVVSAAENTATFRFAPLPTQAAGIPFRAVITAVDSGGRTVEGFTGSVDLVDSTGTLSPSRAGPFVLGRATVLVTIAEIAAGVRIDATDTLGHTGSSDPFAVTAGPPSYVAFTAVPAGATAGACAGPVRVEVRDVLGHASAPAAPIALRLDAAPAGAASFFSDVACTAAASAPAIAAGSSRAEFYVRSALAGTLAVRVVPQSLPSVEEEVVFAP